MPCVGLGESPDDTLEEAANELLAGNQRDFPVLRNGELIGMLRQMAIVKGIRDGGLHKSVRELIDDEFREVDECEMLDRVAVKIQSDGVDATPVMRDGRFVGLCRWTTSVNS